MPNSNSFIRDGRSLAGHINGETFGTIAIAAMINHDILELWFLRMGTTGFCQHGTKNKDEEAKILFNAYL